MNYVYMLQSIRFTEQRYTGITSDLRSRIHTHNAGGSIHTSKFRPWKLVMYIAFEDAERAHAFEGYLKSGSGRAFAKKHLW